MTKCLIVEDEPIVASDLKCRLEKAEYAVAGIADDMPHAIQLLETEKPDLVFMDVNINGEKDGIETARVIRQKYDLPVIFVTSHMDAETIQRAASTGPFGYIVKPYATVNLRAQTEIALSKHQAEQRLRKSEAWLVSTLSSLAEAVIVTDCEGNIAFLNSVAEDLTGWPAAEAVGKPLLEVFGVYQEKTGYPVVTPLEKIYEGESIVPDPVRYRLIHRDQQRCSLVEARFSVNENSSGMCELIVCFSDITERQKAQEQQLQLEKAETAASLADFVGRELSGSTSVTAEFLRELLCRVPEPLRCIARCAYLGVSDVMSLADRLTELGRPRTGKETPIDLNALLLEVKNNWEKMESSQWPVLLDLYPVLPQIVVDYVGCKTNVERCLREAKRAMPEGGEIYLGTELVDNRPAEYIVRLRIRNSAFRNESRTINPVLDSYHHSRSNKFHPGLSLQLFSRFLDTYRASIRPENNVDGNEIIISFSVTDLDFDTLGGQETSEPLSE